MSRDDAWLRRLAEVYFDETLPVNISLDDDDPRHPDDDPRSTVLAQVYGLPDEEPEDCWRFIQISCEMPLSKDQLGLLGAGVFEDLMDAHGGDFLDRLEHVIEGNAALQTVVDGCWTMSVTPEVATRLQALQSDAVAHDNEARRRWWLAQQTSQS